MQIVDLSYPMRVGQGVYPGDPPLEINSWHTLETVGYNLSRLQLGTHQGTHLDAPFHFFEDGKPVDTIPLDRFYGPASLLNLAPGGCLAAGTPLTVEMLEPHDDLFTPGARVLYRTGWERWYGQPEFFRGFPSLTPEAARWIAAHRIALLGMDTPSPSEEATLSHQALLAEGVEVVIVESLANLHLLPPRFLFISFPLRLVGCDGSPVRAVAVF